MLTPRIKKKQILLSDISLFEIYLVGSHTGCSRLLSLK